MRNEAACTIKGVHDGLKAVRYSPKGKVFYVWGTKLGTSRSSINICCMYKKLGW